MNRSGLLHFVRRLHLYAGLLMFPFVLLYGVTAFLYNHPTLFADRPMRYFGRSEVAGTAMHSLPSADEVAQRVVAALNSDGAKYRLVSTSPPVYSREYIFATVKGDADFHNMLLYVDGSGGTIRTRPVTPTVAAPFEQKGGLQVDAPLADNARLSIPAILQRTEAAPGEVTVTSVPDVNFTLEGGGRSWRVTYNSMTGTLTGKPDDGANVPSTRQYLTRLHGSHGYPPHVDARWWWAALVDVLAGVMVFWAASGLFMWWQLRGVRAAGIVLLLISVTTAGILGYFMWGAIKKFG